MTTTTSTESSAPPRSRSGWVAATAVAIAVVVVTTVGFVVVPDLIAHRLGATPFLRDLAVVVWVNVFFIAACWGLVRLQRDRSGGERQGAAATTPAGDAGTDVADSDVVVEIPDSI